MAPLIVVSTDGHVTTPKCRKQGPSTPTVEHRTRGDAGIGENAPKARAAVGEGGQRRVFGSPDSVEVAADQRSDVGIGFGDGVENLPATGRRFDIADPHLQMPLVLRATANECRIQGDHNRRRRRFRPDRSALTKSLADFQGMAAQGLMMLSRVDREHLRQHINGGPVSHKAHPFQGL